jgi:tetratricopeptide (TPR) repeat protein
MLAFVRWAGLDGRDRSRARDLWLGVALFLAALLSKTVTSTLPVIVLVLVWWRTGAVPRRVLGAMVPLVAVGAIFGALTASVERGHVGAVGAAWNQSFAERVLIAGRALWFYLGKLVWPHPLVFVYPRWDLDVASLGQWAFPVTAVAVGVAVIGFARRIGRAPAAVAMAYAVTLAPALGFLNVYPMRYSFVADHFAYLASLPVLALLVGGVTSWSAGAWPRQVRVGVGVATLGVLAVLTAAHAGAFADARTLWLDTLAKNPRATIAHVNLGLQSYQEGHLDDALALFDQGLAVEPDAADLWNDRGLTLIGLGRIPDALDAYEHAVRADPEHAESRNNYGNVLASLGRYDDARAQYEAAVQAHPRYAEAHNNLANILAIGGDARAAVAHYEAALAADPSYADAHRNLGEVALSIGDLAAACDHFGAALRLRSDDLTARVGLGRCLGARGRAAEAVAELRRVLTAAPDAGEAQLALAWILATARDPAVRRPDEALALAEAATAGVPAGDPRGLDTLAAAQASAGRSADAVRSAEQALDLARREAPTIAPAIEARLARYRAGEGWNEP